MEAGRAAEIDPAERWLTFAGGSGLLLWGLARRTPVGIGAAVVGAGLAYRGARGRSRVYRALGIRSVRADGRPGIVVQRAVTIRKPVEEVSRYCRDFAGLPQLTGGGAVEWDAQPADGQRSSRLGWRTVAAGDFEHAGRVELEEGRDRGETVVRVTLIYRAPAGKMGALVGRLLGTEPAQRVTEGLRRLKQVLEAGEAPSTEGQSSGRARAAARTEARP